jgi:hypothetical protein
MGSGSGPRLTEGACYLTHGDKQRFSGSICYEREYRTVPLRHASQRLTMSMRNL